MKIINAILTLLMAVFAILQWNDPDSWLWIFIYGYVTLMAGLTFSSIRLKWFIIAGIIGLLIGIAFNTADFLEWIRSGMPSITGQMKAESPFVEVIREFLGLVIALCVMIYLFFYDRSAGRQVEG